MRSKLLALVLALTACANKIVAGTNDFSVAASPAAVDLNAGASAQVALATQVISGVSQTLSLTVTGLPAGVTASFDQAQIASGATATLTLSAAAGAADATATLAISVSGGGETHAASVALTVQAAPPPAANDFSLALSPAGSSVSAGGATQLAVTTAVTSGSAESVSLSLRGLPAGVTGTFSPATVSAGSSSVLTLSAAAGAAASSTTFTVTGSAASASHDAAGTLTVSAANGPPRNFTLAVSPASATAAIGASAHYTVSTSISSGSAESVTLSVSGVPSGIAASFAAASITSGATTTLTLTPGANAAGASGTFVVTGSAASGAHAATAAITVPGAPSDFSLSLSPSSLTVTQGSTATAQISTAIVSGAAESIALSATGLPAGVTASFSPASVSSGGASTLTLSASASAATGAATLSITGTAGSGTHSASATLTVGAAASGGVGSGGGNVDHLYFAVVGDTRPGSVDQTSSYPTALITKIYQEIEGLNPRPQFVLGTGDYMYSNTKTGTAQPQVNLYMQARAAYSGIFFPAMGNHECDGYTADNCTSLTQTQNIEAFMGSMLQPIGKTTPWYSFPVNGTTGGWTAKFITVACNYWGSAQQSWLTTQLGTPTTYTILTRHEPKSATTGPCVNTVESLMAAHPYDLSLVGHTHTFQFTSGSKEIIVGNGGAPISGSAPYGFVTIERLTSSWQVKEYDYSTGLAVNTYSL